MDATFDIDVNKRSTKQSTARIEMLISNTPVFFCVLILTGSPPHSVSPIRPDSVLS